MCKPSPVSNTPSEGVSSGHLSASWPSSSVCSVQAVPVSLGFLESQAISSRGRSQPGAGFLRFSAQTPLGAGGAGPDSRAAPPALWAAPSSPSSPGGRGPRAVSLSPPPRRQLRPLPPLPRRPEARRPSPATETERRAGGRPGFGRRPGRQRRAGPGRGQPGRLRLPRSPDRRTGG